MIAPVADRAAAIIAVVVLGVVLFLPTWVGWCLTASLAIALAAALAKEARSRL